MVKIGEYKDEARLVGVIQLKKSKKNQPKENSGRYIHGNAVKKHFDTYPQHGHEDYKEIKTVSLKDMPKIIILPTEYSDYREYLVGIEKGTPSFFEINRHRGSFTINGDRSDSELLIGTPI